MRCNFFLLFFIAFLTFACGNSNTPARNCQYGTPAAIFREGQNGILQHAFRLEGNESTETVQFSNGITLTLLQSGCNTVRQEFRFELPQPPATDTPAAWTDQSVRLLQMLSAIGPDYQTFAAWAQSIEAKTQVIRLAETFALEGGFYARIDRILGSDHAILVLTLSDTP